MSTTGMVFRIKDKKAETTEQSEEQSSPQQSLKEDAIGNANGVAVPIKPIETEVGVKEIILKVPVGHAFTEALNLLLNTKKNKSGVIRTESNMTQIAVMNADEGEEDELRPSEANKAYIFVQDGRKMNLGEIDLMINSAKEAKDKGAGYVGVVVEGLEETTAADPTKGEFMSVGALHLESYGVPVIYTRMRAMGAVEKFLGLNQ